MARQGGAGGGTGGSPLLPHCPSEAAPSCRYSGLGHPGHREGGETPGRGQGGGCISASHRVLPQLTQLEERVAPGHLQGLSPALGTSIWEAGGVDPTPPLASSPQGSAGSDRSLGSSSPEESGDRFVLRQDSKRRATLLRILADEAPGIAAALQESQVGARRGAPSGCHGLAWKEQPPPKDLFYPSRVRRGHGWARSTSPCCWAACGATSRAPRGTSCAASSWRCRSGCGRTGSACTTCGVPSWASRRW